MSRNHKLHSVIRHEFFTIIRQPSFWISLLAMPVLIGIIILIGAVTDSSDEVNIDQNIDNISVVVIDESKIIQPEVLENYNLKTENSDQRENLVQQVKDSSIDGLIIYPEDLETTGKYEMYADDTDTDNAAIVTELGRSVLQQSVLAPLESEEHKTLAITGGEGSLQSFSNGKPAREFSEKIIPGSFLVLFYVVLIFSVGYALTSIAEEKENRSIEMVLSYVKPQTLILGKLLAIILVTITQLIIIASLAAVAYFVASSLGNDLSLPFSISDLTFVPSEVLFGIGFLVFGFIFYVALMAMIGAIFPSAKEASGFSTVFFILPAIPFWGLEAITNQPESVFTQFLTYFPLTSPTTVLLRNATGNISVTEAAISFVILIVSTIITVYLAAKAFRLGTLEYTNRIKLASLFSK